MKHVAAIARRELESFFVSPVAYVVLTLWSLLAGSFFLSGLLSFLAEEEQARRLQAAEHLGQLNLNDGLIMPFLGSLWIAMLIAVTRLPL